MSPGARQLGQEEGIAAALPQRSGDVASARFGSEELSRFVGVERRQRHAFDAAAFRYRPHDPFAPRIVVDLVGPRRSDEEQAARRGEHAQEVMQQ